MFDGCCLASFCRQVAGYGGSKGRLMMKGQQNSGKTLFGLS